MGRTLTVELMLIPTSELAITFRIRMIDVGLLD